MMLRTRTIAIGVLLGTILLYILISMNMGATQDANQNLHRKLDMLQEKLDDLVERRKLPESMPSDQEQQATDVVKKRKKGASARAQGGSLWDLKMKRHRDHIDARSVGLGIFEAKHKTMFDLFEPDYDCYTKTRGGTPFYGDGPKFLCDVETIPRPENCLVYSVGSKGQFDFEDEIYRRFQCEMHTFDPTDSTNTWSDLAVKSHSTYHNVGLSFKRKKLGKTDANLVPLRDLVLDLGHEGKTIDILKIDCEGCEWKAFEEIFKDLKAGKYKIAQVLVEVHINKGRGPTFQQFLENVVAPFFAGFTDAGFLMFSKERNQWGCGGYLCVEYSFIHKSVARQSSEFYSALR